MKREVGILCPLSCLPSKYGIGTMGHEAFDFIDFLNSSGIDMRQILPLNVTSFGNSPYQSPSNYGLNYNFIDLDILIQKGLLTKNEVESIKLVNGENRVDYGLIFSYKLPMLRVAYSRFDKTSPKFIEFATDNKEYRDFALFMVLKDMHNLKPWYSRNDEYSIYSETIEKKVIDEHYDDFMFYLWTQFEFLSEYYALKNYAKSKKVKIMGDLPIYVAYDSVEVWKYPELFELDCNHKPINVAGCPPDCFSEDGQLWGNPLYNWEFHKKTNFKWRNDRIDNALKFFDLIRIDHFRGFSAYYSIPFGDTTARNGKWVKGPGIELFKDKLHLNIVAEDLGMVDDDFLDLMRKTKYPGMKIVTQCFEDDDQLNIWRPSNYSYNYFSYTGTHDSPTTKQFIDELDSQGRALMLKVLKNECDKFNVKYNSNLTDEEIVYKICELNIASKSKMAVLTIMDLLALGKEARINYPSKLSDDNWSWRIDKRKFAAARSEISNFLKKMIKKYRN